MWQYYLQVNIQVAWHSLFVLSNLQLERSVDSHPLKPKHSATSLQQPKQQSHPKGSPPSLSHCFPSAVGRPNAQQCAGECWRSHRSCDYQPLWAVGPTSKNIDVTMYSQMYIHTAYRYVYTYIYINNATPSRRCQKQPPVTFNSEPDSYIFIHDSAKRGLRCKWIWRETEWNNTHHFHLHGHIWTSRREHAPIVMLRSDQ